MARAGRVAAGLAAGCVLLAACADDDIRDADGTIVAAGSVSVFELAPGDCLDPDPELTGDIDQIAVIPCSEPHPMEVFAIVEHPDDAYPGAAAVASFADAACIAALDDELGLGLDDGVFFSYLLPSFDGWNQDDDREIVCVLVFPDRDGAVGSVVDGTLVIERVQPAPPRPDGEPDAFDLDLDDLDDPDVDGFDDGDPEGTG